jgi:insertion element IS1 protein InsB
VKLNWHYFQPTSLNEPFICLPISVEVDEQWSFVRSKSHQRWLWLILGHRTHEVLGYAFGPRTHEVFESFLKQLSPLNITLWLTDGLSAYTKLLNEETHIVGKRNTQKIERFFLTLRTRIKRLARRTICFSKSVIMHDTVIGLFINRYCFGRNV